MVFWVGFDESVSGAAKYAAHHLNQVYDAFVVDEVVNPVGFLFIIKNALVSQYRQMLRNVALAGAYLLNDVLDANGVAAEYAQNLKS